MLQHSQSFQRMLEFVAAYAEASDGRLCPTAELVDVGTRIKTELDLCFGLANWHSSMLVRLISAAIEEHPEQMPPVVLQRVQSIMSHALESDRIRSAV